MLRWSLVGAIHMTFSTCLGKAYTKWCPLSSLKRAECFCVAFIASVALSSLWTASITDECTRQMREIMVSFWSSFGWRLFLSLWTYWGQAYWHNSKLVQPELQWKSSFAASPHGIEKKLWGSLQLLQSRGLETIFAMWWRLLDLNNNVWIMLVHIHQCFWTPLPCSYCPLPYMLKVIRDMAWGIQNLWDISLSSLIKADNIVLDEHTTRHCFFIPRCSSAW